MTYTGMASDAPGSARCGVNAGDCQKPPSASSSRSFYGELADKDGSNQEEPLSPLSLSISRSMKSSFLDDILPSGGVASNMAELLRRTTTFVNPNEHIDPMAGLRRANSTVRVPNDGEWTVVQEIGEGAYGTVSEVELHGKRLAMKIVEDGKIVRDELIILKKLQHPYIIELNSYFVNTVTNKCHMFMELCKEGELADFIKRSQQAPPHVYQMDKDCALFCIWQMLSGIAYLHFYNICHRDIKPHNYLIASSSGNRIDLRLIDFGVSTCFKGKTMTTLVGTVAFRAPECSSSQYDELVDEYGVGCTLVYTVTGLRPFGADTARMQKKKEDGYQTQNFAEFWKGQYKQTRDIVDGLIAFDPSARTPSAQVITENKWLAEKCKIRSNVEMCCAIS